MNILSKKIVFLYDITRYSKTDQKENIIYLQYESIVCCNDGSTNCQGFILTLLGQIYEKWLYIVILDNGLIFFIF